MVAYNFKAQFVPLIESGQKRQTIRALGKRRHARVGEWMDLYTGMRTKNCRKVLRAVCLNVQPIKIYGCDIDGVLTGLQVYLSDEPWGLNSDEILELAKADGFESIEEFGSFFKSRMPFEGVLIKW